MVCAFVLGACNHVADPTEQPFNGTQYESESESEYVEESESEGETTEITPSVKLSWDMTWHEIVMYSEEHIGAKKIDREFNSPDTDLSKWFKDYNGQTLQRIYDPTDSTGPAKRGDIIFYNTEETDVQVVLKTMLDVMIQPLMEADEHRKFVITKYELTEQPVKQINENVWLLLVVSGYYSYEGYDLVSMEERMPYVTDVKDGMITFMADGGAGAAQYILVKSGSVYRLQKAGDMGGYGVEIY